jgi:hypothetical protein
LSAEATEEVNVEAALHKSRNKAPKARNMKARGKCEAKRGRRPWITSLKFRAALKGA